MSNSSTPRLYRVTETKCYYIEADDKGAVANIVNDPEFDLDPVHHDIDIEEEEPQPVSPVYSMVLRVSAPNSTETTLAEGLPADTKPKLQHAEHAYTEEGVDYWHVVFTTTRELAGGEMAIHGEGIVEGDHRDF